MKPNQKANDSNKSFELQDTAFDLFEQDYNLKLLTVKVQCPKCGHIWGIKADDYNKFADIPERKFTCESCKN
jgi:DNA-directed RNA polymerase subunit M/transcription elongation factor TFIIS